MDRKDTRLIKSSELGDGLDTGVKERKALRMSHKSVACVTGRPVPSLTQRGCAGRRAGVPGGDDPSVWPHCSCDAFETSK